MDDLISRQWLMECVNEGWIKFDTEKDKNRFIHLVRDIAPSAQPERKPGKWLDDCECSSCHWINEDDEGHVLLTYYNFCPNCGSDMRGNQDENN